MWIGTAGGFGYAPVAPGTFGSIAGVLLFLGLSWLGLSSGLFSGLFYAAIVVGISGVGIWAAGRCETVFGKKDDGRIVIDEVAGQLLTLTPVLLYEAKGVGATSFVWWALVVTGFVVFRVLDIWKPGPVRWAERHFKGGLGVMADDLVAGVIAGLLLAVPCYCAFSGVSASSAVSALSAVSVPGEPS